MRRKLLEYLECFDCGASFEATASDAQGDEILEGELKCAGCGATHPIRRGVPRMVPGDLEAEQVQTQSNFGSSWEHFSTLKEIYRKQFLDWIRFHSIDEAFFKDKLILEVGCGKGRHSYLASSFGARDVVSIDFSSAVDVAFRNTRELGNVHVVQADIHRLPIAKSVFDYVFSIGVLHHLPDPERGFRIALSRVRPGGSISIWVYGRENNGWIVNVINPLRSLTSAFPGWLLYWLSIPLAILLYALLQGLYRPLESFAPERAKGLFYHDYMLYISAFNFNEVHHIIVDHLTAPIAFYLSRAEVEGWFHRAGVERVSMRWHNSNSWSCLAHDVHVEADRLLHNAAIEHHTAEAAASGHH